MGLTNAIMRKCQATTSLLWVGALTAVAGCAAQAAPSPKGPPPASVTTAKINRGTIATYATYDGQITPVYQTTLSTAQAGTVASGNIAEGDFVKGQLLATLDTSQLAASLRVNEATVREDTELLQHSRVAAPINSQQYSSAVSAAQQRVGLQTETTTEVSVEGLAPRTLVVASPPAGVHDDSPIMGPGIATPRPNAPGNVR